MTLKKIISVLLVGSSLLSIATSANAQGGNLSISNDSKYTLSFKINHKCSPQIGVIPKHSIKVISKTAFGKACEYSPASCDALVYKSSNCHGDAAAELVLDTNYGVQSITAFGLNVKGNGYNLFLEGPWMNKQ